MVPRARLINHFFEKKMHIFSKNLVFFWTHPNPKSGSPVGPKNGPKNVPEFRHAFKKVYRNPRNVTKNGPAEGSDFDPESEPNSDTQASVTFSKKKIFKNRKNNSKDCDIWNFIAAVIDTDTNARYRTFIFFHRQPWGSHFLARQRDSKLTLLGVHFLISFSPRTVCDGKLVQF